MLAREFNAVLTTDWQIPAARRCQIVPSDSARHGCTHRACFEYINNPGRLGIFARQICADPR